MTTAFLRFDDEAHAISELSAFRTENGSWITSGPDFALDVVGIISVSGQWDFSFDEPTMIIPPIELLGYHVNFIGTLPDALARYQVFPATPYRVFAS